MLAFAYVVRSMGILIRLSSNETVRPRMFDFLLSYRETTIRLAVVIGVLLLCWLLKDGIRWLLVRVLRAMTFRDPTLVGMERADVMTKLTRIATLPARYLALALGLNIGAAILNGSAQHHTAITYPLRDIFLPLAFTLFTIALALLLGQCLNQIYFASRRRMRLVGVTLEEQLLPFIHSFVWIIIGFIVLVMNLQRWGYDPATLIAGTGLVGLALSLAARDTASNMLGYFVIVMERPFLIGDFIKTGDVAGTVEHVGWRSTKVRRLDQALVSVPNSNLTSANIVNLSRMPKQMLECQLNIAYDIGPERVETLLEQLRAMLTKRDLVAPASIVVVLNQLGEDAIEIYIRCDVLETDWLKFHQEQEQIFLNILRIVQSLGMELTLPSQKLLLQPLGDNKDATSLHSQSFAQPAAANGQRAVTH